MAVVLLTAFLAAPTPAVAGRADGSAQREEVATYACPCPGITDVWHPANYGPGLPGQTRVQPGPGERGVEIVIEDRTATTVYAVLTQGDTDGDAYPDPIGEVCGTSRGPIPIQPDFPVTIHIYSGNCSGTTTPSTPTGGTVAATFSGTPPPGDSGPEGPGDGEGTAPTGCDEPDQPAMSRPSKPGPYEFAPGEIVDLRSDFDGEAIRLGFVRPAVPHGATSPVIVLASPYLGSLLNEGNEERLATYRQCRYSQYVAHGYTVAYVAVRGFGGSGGCSDLMGPAERADLDQAVTWLGEQPWSNGNVGMMGLSYDGSTPWEVAATGNPHLKTLVSMSGVNDMYSLSKHGMNNLFGPAVFNVTYFELSLADNMSRPGTLAATALCPEVIEGLAAGGHSSTTGERDPLGFLAERNTRPGVEQHYRGSVLLARGLRDVNVMPSQDFPWVNGLERRGVYVQYLLGQWGHEQPDFNRTMAAVRFDWADILLDWFGYWLKGDTSVELGPRTQVQDTSGRWRTETGSWPPADTTPVTFYLAPEDRLVSDGSTDPGFTLLAPDAPWAAYYAAGRPEAAECASCAQFYTAPFEDDLRFAGLPRVELSVTPSGPGGHVAAALYSRDTDGQLRRLTWGGTDLRFAQGGERASAVIPGQPLTVKLALEPTDAVVPADSALVLVISQSTYGLMLQTGPAYPIRAELGGTASSLTLETPRRPDVIFTPPPAPAAPSPSPSPTAPPPSAPPTTPSSETSESGTPPPTLGKQVYRVDGASRLETAVALSREAFASADSAVLARSDLFPDALAASGLAGELDAPVLLTPSGGLDDAVADELERLGVTRAYLMGGTEALSERVQRDLHAGGITHTRVGGADRFETATLIAEEITELGGPVRQVTVALGARADGLDAWPDALAAGNLAASGRAPILLTTPEELPQQSAAALDRLLDDGDLVFIAGGEDAVGKAPEQELRAHGYAIQRLAGADRYATAVAIVRRPAARARTRSRPSWRPARRSLTHWSRARRRTVWGGSCCWSTPRTSTPARLPETS